VTRGWLPQRAGSTGLNGGVTAAVVPTDPLRHVNGLNGFINGLATQFCGQLVAER